MYCTSERGGQSVGQAKRQNASTTVILLATSSLALVMLQFGEKCYLHFYYQYVHIDTYLYANLNDIC